MIKTENKIPNLDSESLSRLSEVQENALIGGHTIVRAAGSCLYRKIWKHAGVNPAGIRRLTDIRKLPFLTSRHLAEASAEKNLRSLPCSEVIAWLGMTAGNGTTWRMPCSQEDVKGFLQASYRFSRVIGLSGEDTMLITAEPAPSFAGALPHFLVHAHRLLGGPKTEIMPVSLDILKLKPGWIDFLLSRKPTVLLSRPDQADKLAGMIADHGNKTQHRLSFLPGLKKAVFYGALVSTARRESLGSGTDTIQTYGIAEMGLLNTECLAHRGVHIWLDSCLAEILPDTGADSTRGKPGDAVLLTEARPGLTGELVITTFSQALPLVRYRTGEVVRVINTGRCACGRTHPTVDLVSRPAGAAGTAG